MFNENIGCFKPDAEMAIKRTEAFWNKDIIDRPIMRCVLTKENPQFIGGVGYYGRCFDNVDTFLKDALHNCGEMEYLGESMPNYWASLGTHEIAQYCGYDVEWAPDKETNWCKHAEKPLSDLLPLKIDDDNYFWKRSVEIYEKSSEIFKGKVIPMSYDFHSNMDLLLSVRGDANLCMDLFDCPDMVKVGLKNSLEIYAKMWNTFAKASKGNEYGYYFELFSDKPTTNLACDFSALISKDMFNEFALPILIAESEIIGDRCFYHWDGPDAIKHFESLMTIKNIHTLSYVPTPGTYHYQFLDLYQQCQSHGKSIVYKGTFEEIKEASKVLKPNLTIYDPIVSTVSEFEQVEDWLIKNT